MQIIKSDESSGKRISGVRFEVRKVNGEIVGTYVTDKLGVIQLPDLDDGWYQLTEIKAPKGYLLDSTPQKVEVKKETSLQKEATEISETTEITEAAVNTETQKTSDFYISKIPDDIFEKMQGKSYKADCTVPRDELRYVHVLHMGFDGQTKEGELVVNKAIADDVLAIFEELYQADYPIEKVELVDAYNADDEESMSHNNSSAFNFRFISHTTKISKHGLGMAVDINTLYNPYVKTVDGKLSIEPANATAYVDRSKDFPYKIDHDDLCYKLFTKYGFTWGGDWTHSKDYQHFERDY